MSEVTVRLRVPAALRHVVDGRSTVESPVPATGPNGTPDVRALFDHLARALPDLERRVRDEQGTLRRHVNVFVGTTSIRDLDGQDTALAEGDEVAILPAVSGGAGSAPAAPPHRPRPAPLRRRSPTAPRPAVPQPPDPGRVGTALRAPPSRRRR